VILTAHARDCDHAVATRPAAKWIYHSGFADAPGRPAEQKTAICWFEEGKAGISPMRKSAAKSRTGADPGMAACRVEIRLELENVRPLESSTMMLGCAAMISSCTAGEYGSYRFSSRATAFFSNQKYLSNPLHTHTDSQDRLPFRPSESYAGLSCKIGPPSTPIPETLPEGLSA
jgi:hypothetical protein